MAEGADGRTWPPRQHIWRSCLGCSLLSSPCGLFLIALIISPPEISFADCFAEQL